MAALVGQIARLHGRGIEVLLVSSGAVAAGRHVLGVARDQKNLPLRQVLAAVGQGRLMHAYEQLFGWHDIPVAQALLSRRDLSDRLGYLNIRNTLLGLLEHKAVPIINENDVVAVEELTGETFGDNDTLSAMVANLVDADLLVMLGQVQGLYTADPNLDASARLVPIVERLSEEIESMGGPSWGGLGRGGMATKLEAARLATASGVNAVIASGLEKDAIVRLADGESIGTFFPSSGSKMESRKRWMLSGLSTRGELIVDDGAARALRHQNRSLLPAGVKEVAGSFERGDIISILDSRRGQVACGIANYSAQEAARIKGLHSDLIAETLGHQYGDEVVHRNNMVIL
jgi:glutamate 5-kinase